LSRFRRELLPRAANEGLSGLSNNARLKGALVGRNIELSNNQVLYRVGTQAVPPPLTAP
jgi:hypothetical protein